MEFINKGEEINRIRLSKSSISIAEKKAVMEVLDEESLGMGAQVELFEKKIKSYIQTDMEVVCVNTGTSALHISLASLGIGVGDEVLVPSLTYVASFQAISATGATPIPCEVIPNTLFIDIVDAKKRITNNTRAIMPVHYASSSKGMSDVYSLAHEFKLRVVEDAAQAFGCKRSGKVIGVEGDIICFSFDGIKNITSGEGGAILSKDGKFIQKLQDARLLGVEKDTENRFLGLRSWDFDVTSQGWRYHMSNIMASIGLVQIDRIDEFKLSRQKIVQEYIKGFTNIREVNVLDFDFIDLISHIFVIKVKKRDELKEYLTLNGIECGVHYKPNHLLTKYSIKKNLPVTEKIYKEILTLPCHNDLTIIEQKYIIKKIKVFFNY
jgi:dTDP-4-amino-4,6-dideoxygalactose transaminase